MSDIITIGVDHGYAAMKTAHFSFPTGLVEYNQVDYMHLTRADHARLARALESEITRLV